ncbi:maleylpyruvate isomerase family mycothiol-dependent enzyme [Granulicoccus sp. GXG6511]|uniref:maleylpyruvate isomerase family mycothiol-dependent enzyme n=1 Tax=Granulicoccus sp. GXG6511 TaxID=3381351 RepID=UPI003D7E1469
MKAATTLTNGELWQAVDAQRRQTLDLLTALPEAAWSRQSLCSEWTVKQVAAHLAWQGAVISGRAIPAMVAALIRTRGDMFAAIGASAVRHAAVRTPAQIVGELRALVGKHRHLPGGTDHEVLIDVLVHHQDMALPLGHRLEMDPAAAAEAADRAWSQPKGFTLPVTQRLARFRWRATDIAWDRGDGPLIEGPMGAILLALMGREIALDHLEGPVADARSLLG